LSRLITIGEQITDQINQYGFGDSLSEERNIFLQEQRLLAGKVMIEHLALPKMIDVNLIKEHIKQEQIKRTALEVQIQ
jgi:hypothetical protein